MNGCQSEHEVEVSDAETAKDGLTELYQLGIKWPDGSTTWGDPVLHPQEAKAAGYYVFEVGELHRQFLDRIAIAHGTRPEVFPWFVYRHVTLGYSPVRNVV